VKEQWEYLVVEFSGKTWVDSRGAKGRRHKNDLNDQGDRLTKLGAEGWQLTSITQEDGYRKYRLYFRRQVTPDTQLVTPPQADR
jgi:hypothetical protein